MTKKMTFIFGSPFHTHTHWRNREQFQASLGQGFVVKPLQCTGSFQMLKQNMYFCGD